MDDVIDRLRAADERTEPLERFDFDAMLRRGRRRARRRRAAQAGASFGAAAALAVGASLFWPGESPDSTVAGDPEPAEVLELLAEPQQPEDELPTLPDGREMGDNISESTSRLVYESEDVGVWAGLGHMDPSGSPPAQSEICVVANLPDWGPATACAPPSRFAEQGVWIGNEVADGRSVDAWLLPDGYELGRRPMGFRPHMEGVSEWVRVNENLALGREE